MENNCSTDWNRLLQKKYELMKESFYYNHQVEEHIKKSDLQTVLHSNDSLLIIRTLEMIDHQELLPDMIDLVLSDLVYVAITGTEECAGLASKILIGLDKNQYEQQIIELSFFHIEENKEDTMVFLLAFSLFYNLKNREALLALMKKYPEEMEREFSTEDLEEYLQEL